MNNSIERRRQAKGTFHRTSLDNHSSRGFHNGYTFPRFFLFILLAAILFFIGLYISVVRVGSIVLDTTRIEIPPGENVATLVDNEPFQSLVSPWRYKWYMRLFADPPSKFNSGIYPVEKGTTIESFFEKTLRSSSGVRAARLTILPGWNLYDIDAYLTKKGYISSGELIENEKYIIENLSKKYIFLKQTTSLEGYIYPDTHEILESSDLTAIIDRFVGGFDKKIYQHLSDQEKRTLSSDLILASILQKEERNPVNYSAVASVLKTRLKNNIALGADATTCYAYKIPSSKCTPDFIGDHIRETNDYNTRTLRGLPRGPISNVTADIYRASLDASDQSEYLYYLHDNDGVLRLSRKLEEHNAKVQQYLR